MKRPWFSILFVILIAFGAVAQVDSLPEDLKVYSSPPGATNDSTVVDSTVLELSEVELPLGQRILGEYPNPRTALLMSLILPGAGQAYNKKYWKIPLVYGTLGYLAWRISENRETYQKRRDAYIAVVTRNSNIPIAPELQGLPANSLRILRDNSKKQLESNWIFLVLAYTLNGVEAYVDAHLLEFDVSEDLSLRLNPTLVNDLESRTALPNTLGLKVSMSF